MYDLKLRTNINCCKAPNERPIIIYEDHRCLIFVLYHAYLNGILDKNYPPNLICFDKHDDNVILVKEVVNILSQYRRNLPNEKEFLSFVEWELSGLDDDWLVAAMELGFISNVVFIGSEPAEGDSRYNKYKDHLGTIHKIWYLNHLWDELKNGCLSHSSKKEEYSELWNVLGWDLINNKLNFNNDCNLLLDIDLDCFTETSFQINTAYTREKLHELMMERIKTDESDICSRKFLIDLAKKSPFITIAMESDWCGGISQSHQILESLNDIIFDGKLSSVKRLS